MVLGGDQRRGLDARPGIFALISYYIVRPDFRAWIGCGHERPRLAGGGSEMVRPAELQEAVAPHYQRRGDFGG
jgi:hypothetical protein